MRETKISVLVLCTSDSMIWIPCLKIDKYSCLYHPSPFEPGIIFKESLFDCTYLKKLWNSLHWKVFWKNTDLSRTIATAKMDLFVALVCSFQPLSNFTKNASNGAMGILNVSLKNTVMYSEICAGDQIKYCRMENTTLLKIIYFTS